MIILANISPTFNKHFTNNMLNTNCNNKYQYFHQLIFMQLSMWADMNKKYQLNKMGSHKS
jgi:hypothetical protein